MPRKGWIKLHHSLLDNPIWLEKPFDEGHAWVDLLLLAAHEEHKVNGETWEPGTVHLSRGFFMDRWGWTKWKLDRTLAKWEQQNMIQRPAFQQGFQQGCIRPITVVKWDFFQGGKRKNQHGFQHGFQQQHKNIYKKGGDGGSSPRPAGKVEMVKVNGEWVAKQR